MLHTLISTCQKLETNWQRESFPNAARACLEKLILDTPLEDFEAQVMDWLNDNDNELPSQLNLYNNFGEPSLTLFNNGKFAIDIYFWRKNDTLIHSHGFRGAFKVLFGLSVHEEFEVETTDTFSKELLRTNLIEKSIRVMKPGDVQQINPDMELTHRIVHLANPTVTLCVRTVEDTKLNQWHHLTTGLSFQKKHISEKTIKKNLYFQYLLESEPEKARTFYLKMIDELGTASQIALYEGLFFGELGLDEAATEIAVETIQDQFVCTKWFALYEKHYQILHQEIQGANASSPALKFLAHAINNNHPKNQTAEILKCFSEQGISELCEELKSTSEVFTEGCELMQVDKIDGY